MTRIQKLWTPIRRIEYGNDGLRVRFEPRDLNCVSVSLIWAWRAQLDIKASKAIAVGLVGGCHGRPSGIARVMIRAAGRVTRKRNI